MKIQIPILPRRYSNPSFQSFFERYLIPILIYVSLLFSTTRSMRVGKEFFSLSLIIYFFLIVKHWKEFSGILTKKRIYVLFVVLGFYALCTTFWSYDSTYTFLMSAIFNFLIITSIIIGYLISIKRANLFTILTQLNIVFLIGAVLSLFTGIPDDAWTANHGKGFMAFMSHQNTFAALFLFTSLGPVAKTLFQLIDIQTFKRNNLRYKVNNKLQSIVFYFTLIILNTLFIFSSHSRTSTFCILLFISLAISLLMNRKIKIIFISVLTTILIIIYFTPQLKSPIESFALKGNNSFFSTREILFKPSFDAAENGGIFGIGFGISDPTVHSNYENYNKLGRTVREKGNSVLAFVEELGITGLLLMLIIISFFIKHYLNLSKQCSSNSVAEFKLKIETQLLLIFVFILFLHSQFEGWWVWLGSIYLQIYMIIICYDPAGKLREDLIEA